METINPLVGACATHPDPDLWFPEFGSGTVTQKRIDKAADKIIEAMSICNGCDIKQTCLEQGMTGEDLQFGIWGGKMAAQRMMAAGHTQGEFALYSEQGRAFGLYEKVKPILEAHFEQ